MSLSAAAIVFVIIGSIIGCCAVLYLAAFCLARQHASHCEQAETLVPQVKASLNNKIVLITGATSGIGKETARVFSKSKCTLILGCRNINKAESLRFNLSSNNDCNAKILIEKLDLSDLNQIKNEFVPNLSNKHSIDKINIIQCNAGIAAREKGLLSANGYELTFATNHLGHMLMVMLLKPMLDNAFDNSNGNEKSRLIVTSSSLHSQVPQSLMPPNNNINNNAWQRTYDPNSNIANGKVFSTGNSYAWSKLCNLWFAREFEKRYNKEGKIIAVSLHPGVGLTGYVCRMYTIINPHFQTLIINSYSPFYSNIYFQTVVFNGHFGFEIYFFTCLLVCTLYYLLY